MRHGVGEAARGGRGAHVDRFTADVMAGVTRSTEFLLMNPAGQVPTVVLEDGRALAQSNAIIGWLAEGADFIHPAF